MKKIFILILLIIIAGIFITGCPMNSIYYCPYCSKGSVKKVEDNVYKCTNPNCGKTFGAEEIKD